MAFLTCFSGVGLSGGQRARVSLARALYSRARILLLDDPVSALDHTTAESIIRRAFTGALTEGRAVVLVTHRTQMVRHIATQFVDVSDGQLTICENPFDATAASTPEQDTEQKDVTAKDGKAASGDQVSAFIEEEKRESGGIKGKVWITFIMAAKWWWLLLAIMMILTRILSLLKTWFYKAWGEAYARGATDLHLLWANQSILFRMPSDVGTLMEPDGVELAYTSFDPSDYLPAPQEDLRPWLICLFILAVLAAISLLGYAISQVTAVYATSKNMYAATIKRVTHATFRFYDVTPTGRILNRLTSDISVLDNALTYFGHTIFFLTSWLMSVAVIAFVSPLFLILAGVLMFVFVLVFRHFLPTSRNLKRLESSSLSPVFTHFGELLQSQGLVTVRAYHSQQAFTESTTDILDQVQGCTHFYWSVQNWLLYRYQNMGGLAGFLLTVAALITNLSPGITAFMLNYAWTLIYSTHTLCLRFGDLQTEFISVERIVELLNIEQEPPGTRLPPASWPRFGAPITFRNVTVRYAPHLDPSLKDITLSIPGGRVTAIIGRTGSGKSTLALALLSIVRAETGSIEIDGEDLAALDVQTLRSRVTFIPQEPVLFDGTVRENLDPVGEFDEAACAAVLERIAASAGQAWSLGDRVEAGGHNFSQGQRQLLGLTRAVLRRSPVVVLDEATASIDLETSLMLQAVIREEMAETTVLTVAHRVEAVRGADYVVVLEDGRVKRQGPVGEVLAAEEGGIDGHDRDGDE
jgi:ABC-type multidrug transport system fused ATPase/permease subunit